VYSIDAVRSPAVRRLVCTRPLVETHNVHRHKFERIPFSSDLQKPTASRQKSGGMHTIYLPFSGELGANQIFPFEGDGSDRVIEATVHPVGGKT
jgi:hypothetical protein